MTIGALTSPRGDQVVERAGRPCRARRSPASRSGPAGPGSAPAPAPCVIQRAQRLVLREQVEHRLVGAGDVLRVAGQRRPAERALALAEQRPDVGRDEAGEVERARVAGQLRLAADRVAVVEDLGALVLEADHRLDVAGHRLARAVGELLRLALRRSRASRRTRRRSAGRPAGRARRSGR